jgi:leucine dehydrogenase
MGMKACAREVWGSDSLRDKKVAIQGFGKVASYTAQHLLKEGAQLVVSDVYPAALDRARDLNLKMVAPEEIYEVECDIFSPCALGGVLNDDTIPRLKCRIVAGGANNQLLNDAHGLELHRRRILYAPDYIINAGGIINVAAEIGALYNPERAREKTERIYETMGRVIDLSKREEIPTSQAGDRLAEERLASVQAIKKIYRKR